MIADCGVRIADSKDVSANPQSTICNPQSEMPITRTEVEKIAKLANLELTDAEKESFSGQLAAIVEYIDQLNELDTSTVTPWQTRSVGEAATAYASRDDVVEPSLGQETALGQAPDPDEGHFTVPRVI